MPDARTLDTADDGRVDPIDREAAQIDARSDDAPEVIEELIEHACDLGDDAAGEGTAQLMARHGSLLSPNEPV